jgi:hypothetical protein
MYFLSVFKDQSFSYQGYMELPVRINYLFVSYWTLRHVFQNILSGIKGEGYIAALVIVGQIKWKKTSPQKKTQKNTKNSPIFHLLDNYVWLRTNRIGGVMVSVVASSVGDREFESRSDQTKHYKIGICCFSSKHASLNRKSKDWLAKNQDNVSEWSDMSIGALLFQWASTIKIQLSVLV